MSPASSEERSPELQRTPSIKSYSHHDQVNEELKNVLTMFRERKKRNLEVLKTPEVFIKQTSNPDEVQKWLHEKGFPEAVCKKMNRMTGYDMFALSKDQLEKYCGETEGKRLASQITLQKEVSGVSLLRK